MATQKKAVLLYDFEGDTESGELSVREGDVVIIMNMDVGDGWWEVKQDNGVEGLVPESYCEIMDEGNEGNAVTNHDGIEDWQDEWDENDDEFPPPVDGNVTASVGGDKYEQGSVDDTRAVSPGQQSGSIAGRHGTVKKNINRFSPFVKTGTETFILGSIHVKRDIKPHECVKVVKSEDGVPMWEPLPNPFEVEVLNPRKQSKFKGIKSFIAYEIVRLDNRQSVSRRYKHYDWLHERLVNKFTFVNVPPLPDKQYYGRYGEEFVDKRREKLQMWTNRVARHPILSRSDVFHHFLSCPDSDEKEWKSGKRKAEKDEIVGGSLYLCIEPQIITESGEAEKTVEQFGGFLEAMEDGCTKMKAKFIDHCNKMSGPFRAEFQKMAEAIHGLGHCFGTVNEEYNTSLTSAIHYTADVYREIAAMHDNQPKKDMIPTMDVLKEYLGLIQEFPGSVDIHKGAMSKVKDCEKMKEEGRIDFMEASEITSRAEKVSSIVLAEIYHFQRERVVDFRKMMKDMLKEQIDFYTQITEKLKSAQARYDESTDL